MPNHAGGQPTVQSSFPCLAWKRGVSDLDRLALSSTGTLVVALGLLAGLFMAGSLSGLGLSSVLGPTADAVAEQVAPALSEGSAEKIESALSDALEGVPGVASAKINFLDEGVVEWSGAGKFASDVEVSIEHDGASVGTLVISFNESHVEPLRDAAASALRMVFGGLLALLAGCMFGPV